jgi:hypothetical protein
MLGTMLIDGLEYLKTRDPKAFESTKIGFKNSFIPSMRAISAPFGDIRANKDFADRSIVPAYMLDQSPGTQADEKTSMPAKWLGEKMNWSPKQIDYLVGSYTGVLGQLGIPAMSEGGSVKEVISRQLTVDPAYSNDTVTRFYDAKNKTDTAYNDAKAKGTTLSANDEKVRKVYSKVAETIADANTQKRAIERDKALTPEARKAKLRGIQMAIVEMSEIANKPLSEQLTLYNQLKKKGFITETKAKTSTQIKKAETAEDKKYGTMTDMFTK